MWLQDEELRHHSPLEVIVVENCTDTTKAIMQDGEWFLVPAKHVVALMGGDRESVIVHRCHRWTSELRNEYDMPYSPLGYWNNPGSEQVPCKLCRVRPPEAIASLFLLHNFDTFARDEGSAGGTVGRMVSRAVSKAMHSFEKQYFVQDTQGTPCVCTDCCAAYGGYE